MSLNGIPHHSISEVDVVDVETQSAQTARLHLLGELLDMDAAEEQVADTEVR